MATLTRLIASWRASHALHRFEEGATEAELKDFEDRRDGSFRRIGAISTRSPTEPVVENAQRRRIEVAGSSLSTFLLARTTYFLVSDNAPEAAFDALAVSHELRRNIVLGLGCHQPLGRHDAARGRSCLGRRRARRPGRQSAIGLSPMKSLKVEARPSTALIRLQAALECRGSVVFAGAIAIPSATVLQAAKGVSHDDEDLQGQLPLRERDL